MIKNNTTLSSSTTVLVGPGATESFPGLGGSPAPAGYSDVYNNAGFDKVSWHCPTAEVTVYISNKLMPNEENDNDWIEAGTGKLVHIEYPFSWFRVKGVSADNITYVQRYSHKM